MKRFGGFWVPLGIRFFLCGFAAVFLSMPTAAASRLEIELIRSSIAQLHQPERHLSFAWKGPEGEVLPFLHDEEILDFLRTARVVGMKRIGEGINRTRKVLLEADGIRMHAAFRDVHVDRYLPDPRNEHFLMSHRDDYRFEVAAYWISRLLELDFVPPTVVRVIDGEEGSLQAWVEQSMMEKDRRKEQLSPPDEWVWISQMLTMQLFDNLVGNTDRHQGNLLIDSDWRIWLIDHTQAFRRFPQPHDPKMLIYCKSTLWDRLQTVDRDLLTLGFNGLLRDPEIESFLQRRDFLIEQLQREIESRGVQEVLF